MDLLELRQRMEDHAENCGTQVERMTTLSEIAAIEDAERRIKALESENAEMKKEWIAMIAKAHRMIRLLSQRCPLGDEDGAMTKDDGRPFENFLDWEDWARSEVDLKAKGDK